MSSINSTKIQSTETAKNHSFSDNNRSLLDRLEKILNTFKTWNDRLSVAIIKNTSQWKKIDVAAIDLFTRETLVNPLTRLPLHRPVLGSDGWTWEEGHYKEYCYAQLGDSSVMSSGNPEEKGNDQPLLLSPFNQQPLSIVPHTFAEEIISWIKAVKSSTANSPSSFSLIEASAGKENSLISTDKPLDPQLILFGYSKFAENAKSLEMYKARTDLVAQVFRDAILTQQKVHSDTCEAIQSSQKVGLVSNDHSAIAESYKQAEEDLKKHLIDIERQEKLTVDKTKLVEKQILNQETQISSHH